MDLAKAPARMIATLILNGNKQLDEIPSSRRVAVSKQIRLIEAEQEEAKKLADKEAKKATKNSKK